MNQQLVEVKNPKMMKGSVLVIGGGIGGIQTSLDLADLGFKVYLAEKSPSIGGNMVKLDKTFPTNDCSMCMISPKLVACARHPNIEILSLAEIQDVSGELGSFRIQVKQLPRSVDEEKCTGCGVCIEECPVRYIVRIPTELPPPPEISQEDQKFLNDIISEYQDEPGFLIPLLQRINSKYRYLPKDLLINLSRKINSSLAYILRVASFYSSFSLIPVGKNLIEICYGATCRVRGSEKMINWLQNELNIETGQTTPDMRFTLRTVNCLGCCASAPAMRINEATFASVKQSQLGKILKAFE